MLPGTRELANFSGEIGSTKQTAQDAKVRGRTRLRAAAKAHGTDFDTVFDAYKRGQETMRDVPTQPPSAP